MFDPRVDYIIAEFKKFNQQFCKKAKCCLGISENGNPNLVLNQQGDWITSCGCDIQDLLSDLPEYLGAKEASEDGKPLGYWYYNTFNNTVSKVTQYIDSYTAGTSTIDFTNNGGDDWDIEFKITPDTVQSTANIIGYQYYIQHWVAGVKNGLDAGFKTSDYTYNAVGNGAGVYLITQVYAFDDSSIFVINSLVKVDGSGTILYSVEYKGITVNSVSGLSVDTTANIVRTGVTYPIKWYSFTEFPPTNPLTLLGSGATLNTTIPIDSVGFGFAVDLGTEFTDDFPPPNTASSILSLIIN